MKHLIIRLTGLLSILVLAAVTMVGSWSADNFFYQPSLGARGPVEKVHFDSGLNRADTPLGDPNYSNLSEVLNTIGTETEITLTISAGTVPVTTNTFIPANIGLRILKGGKFNISGGKILTINGPIEAGWYQIFSCSAGERFHSLPMVGYLRFIPNGGGHRPNGVAVPGPMTKQK